MKHLDYPAPFTELVRQFNRLPGIGPRSAERIALWITRDPDAKGEQLANAILKSQEALKTCRLCGFYTSTPECMLCIDPVREGREICVVETANDILPLERTGIFRGRYHALGGKLSPLSGVAPEDLRIHQLQHRIETEHPTEIVLALGADVEGEMTANFLADILAPSGVKITRIAQGLPAGGGIEQSDPVTLQRALANRSVYTPAD